MPPKNPRFGGVGVFWVFLLGGGGSANFVYMGARIVLKGIQKNCFSSCWCVLPFFSRDFGSELSAPPIAITDR